MVRDGDGGNDFFFGVLGDFSGIFDLTLPTYLPR